eukprot:scaffold1073_cov383-Prasinococcus_capsulatus_cf.AAC.9
MLGVLRGSSLSFRKTSCPQRTSQARARYPSARTRHSCSTATVFALRQHGLATGIVALEHAVSDCSAALGLATRLSVCDGCCSWCEDGSPNSSIVSGQSVNFNCEFHAFDSGDC